jgi:hypothetical protein
MKQELKEAIEATFKRSSDVNKVYVTSDDCVFVAGHYADSWKSNLADKAVAEVTREAFEGKKPVVDAGGDDDTTGGAGGGDQGDGGEKEKEAALIKLYIELFDRKPDANLSIDGIKAAIAEKEAEGDRGGKKPEPVIDPAKAERAALAKEYIELTGKQPVGLSLDKLKAKLAELKAQ